jgi:hypothetical protein
VPAQPITKASGLRSAFGREVAHRVAQLERLIDGSRVADKKDVHRPSLPRLKAEQV